MNLLKICHFLSAAFLLMTLGSFSIHADSKKNRTDDWDRQNDNYPNNPVQLRSLIDQQIGIDKLKVPATDAEIPLPPDDPSRPGRYRTTEEKRFLGKLLFHDPIRTARVNKGNSGDSTSTGEPKFFPAGSAFGGTFNASDSVLRQIFPATSEPTDAEIENIAKATAQTGSCGSCHIGEAAGKAGEQLNFNTGGEGRGYTDREGNFIPRRRPQSILAKLRETPLFPGDLMVDTLPTLTDTWVDHGTQVVTTPAYFYHYPNPPGALNPTSAAADPNLQLLATGRLDQLDSVGRLSPSMIGFAFNNRLLFGGFAGEPQATPGSLNPLNDPAQENLNLLLLDAHRMIGFQAAELLKIPAYRKLFRDAFPEEAAEADATGDMTKLINDVTEFRAQATFLRTVVTRNTPFDRFLSGDNRALTSSQRRGARLFFTPANEGGAGCVSCHSGPMLNKQPNDPDVTGVGAFVEENFANVGIGDHPVQALNALARGRLDPARLGKDGFPYHAEDTGREEITHNPNDRFKFRSLTLRQLRDGRQFFHNGSFSKVRDVVEYFNAGIPQDPTAATAGTLSQQFTNPRGPGYPRGLGLSRRQVDDLTDFLENGLYDPALVHYDPKSTTDTLQPNARDLTYSKYRPDLALLGAKDGLMPSGLAIDDNDPLARRDQGLEFLDVTDKVNIEPINSHGDHWSKSEYEDDDEKDYRHHGARNADRFRITNTDESVIDTHLLVIVKGLPKGVNLRNASGKTRDGNPYRRIFLRDGVLKPNQSLRLVLRFNNRNWNRQVPYSLVLLSGQGNP